MSRKWGWSDPDTIVVIVGIFLLGLAVGLSIALEQISTGYGMEILLIGALVLVTMWYGAHTKRMANEMREQRLMSSRPVVIQRVESKWRDAEPGILRSDYFSHFEIYNAGNGPAIELEIAVMKKEDFFFEAIRETFLKAGDDPIELRPECLQIIEGTYYLVSEYQGILSRIGEESWYQTWLPFKVAKASKEGEVYVTAGELEFKEVTKKDRIDNLIRWSKPK